MAKTVICQFCHKEYLNVPQAIMGYCHHCTFDRFALWSRIILKWIPFLPESVVRRIYAQTVIIQLVCKRFIKDLSTLRKE